MAETNKLLKIYKIKKIIIKHQPLYLSFMYCLKPPLKKKKEKKNIAGGSPHLQQKQFGYFSNTFIFQNLTCKKRTVIRFKGKNIKEMKWKILIFFLKLGNFSYIF